MTTTECEFCRDDAHTSCAHQDWIEWHNDLLAGRPAGNRPEPELRRSNAVDPRESPDA